MPDSTTTETIVIRWMVENQDAIAKHKELEEAVVSIKKQLKELSASTGATYKEMAKAMVSAFSEGKVKDIMANNPIITQTQAMKQAAPEIAKYKEAMVRALSEIRVENATSNNIATTASRNFQAQQQAEVRAIQEAQQKETQAKRQAVQEWLRNNQQQITAMKYLEQQAKSTASTIASTGGGSGGGLGGILGGLGGLAKGALGFAGALVGITSLLSGLRQVTSFLGSAAEQGQKFAQSMFAMEVGVRALQRAGVEITLEDMNNQLMTLKKNFGIFSRTDLVEGTAAFLNLNRDMGFTKDQLFELQNAIATLAVVNGRSMDEVQKTVALALSSGYTEGLQRLGVSINRVTIAQEAANMGWEGGYTSLTEVQRAAATYNLIIRKTAIYEEDLLRYQATLPGKIDTATKAIQDQTVAIGENLLQVKLWIAEAELSFLRLVNAFTATKVAFNDFRDAFLKNQEDIKGSALTQGEINRFSEQAGIVWQAGVFRGGLTPQQMFERYKFPSEKWNPQMGAVGPNATESEKNLALIQSVVDDNLDDIKSAEEEFQTQSKEAWDDYQQDLIDMETEFYRDLDDLERDWERRKLENQTQHERKEVEMATDYQRDIDKINSDALQKSVDEVKKYERDVAQAWADYYARVADAQAKYQNQQIDAEVAFQERMRKLREGLMFDLEDALRARDARQVLQLLRRYNLEKTQAEREYKQQKDKAARDFADQMAQLARQRDERLAQLYQEMQARLAAITEEARREKEARDAKFAQDQIDEDIKFQQEQDDEDTRYKERVNDRNLKWEQDKIDRDLKYQQELTDLENHLNARYEKIAQAMANELSAITGNMTDVRKVLNDTLGPGGAAEKIYTYFAQIMASIGALMSVPMIMPPPPNVKMRAKGGVDIASSPTTATFGEAGPEMAMFIPLNKSMSDLGNGITNAIGMAKGGASGGGTGRVVMEVLLDPRLEGRIVDTTLENVADVIIRRLR